METVKVELGCGFTKTPGYIGIDRFPLPGVDIVTDLNEGIPLEDNSVDVLYSSHSLEHYEDINTIMQEINRVCKDGAIVNLFLPYDNTYINYANRYHKINFNEHTFRFFTTRKERHVDDTVLDIPFAHDVWGLMSSDNSVSDIDLRCINIEFFYCEEYIHYDEHLKGLLRNSLNNVCDSLLYSLVVCKQNQSFSDKEIEQLRERAKSYLTETNETYLLRKNRELSAPVNHNSLYAHIMNAIEDVHMELSNMDKEVISSIDNKSRTLEGQLQNIKEGVNKLEDKFKGELKVLKDKFKDELKELKDKSKNELKLVEDKLEDTSKQAQMDSKEIKELLDYSKRELESKIKSDQKIIFELYKAQESKEIRRFCRRDDILSTLRYTTPAFADALILKNNMLTRKSMVTFGESLNIAPYVEYEVENYCKDEHLNILVAGNLPAKILYEIVQNDTIIKQEIIYLQDGHNRININGISGKFYIRFVITDLMSIIKICEIRNSRFLSFSPRKSLAYFCD